MRIQKWLSMQGVCSRRTAEEWIQEGLITVNGKAAQVGCQIDPANDHVKVKGRLVNNNAQEHCYILLHKPLMTLVSNTAEKDMETIYSLPQVRRWKKRFLSVGRLDFLSEGLLLLTTDGDLNHKLMHPNYGLTRTYHVLISGVLNKEVYTRINNEKVLIEGKPVKAQVRPMVKRNLGASKGTWVKISLQEGRNRIIRKLFAQLDVKVLRLVRVQYGPVHLENELQPGRTRALSREEVQELRASCVQQ